MIHGLEVNGCTDDALQGAARGAVRAGTAYGASKGRPVVASHGASLMCSLCRSH